MLMLIKVANVASKLGAVVLSMGLQLRQGLPDELALALGSSAPMGELTEVDAVLDDLVDFLHEVALRVTIGATRFLILA